MVSKACIVGVYQKKLEEMVSVAPDLSLTVVVPPYWRDERGKTRLEREHTAGYRFNVQPLLFNGAFHLHFYPRLGRVIDQLEPDIVHIDEEPYNLATYHANRLARRSGARTLWFSWQNLQRRYPPPFSWFERYNLRHIDWAVAGSRTAAKVWRRKGYRGPIDVIPQFGVDPITFSPPPQPRREGPVHIAYVGRLVPEKGVDLLLSALSDMDNGWRATLLGSGPAEERLRNQAANLGLTDRVSFRSWLPSAQMPDFYREIDILVLPSRARPNWTEQFGRVLIEAMASEVVVVGSDVGEIPHVIQDAGRLFAEGDISELRTVLTDLVRSPTLRQSLGSQGRRRVLDRYTQRQVAKDTVSVYRKMIA